MTNKLPVLPEMWKIYKRIGYPGKWYCKQRTTTNDPGLSAILMFTIDDSQREVCDSEVMFWNTFEELPDQEPVVKKSFTTDKVQEALHSMKLTMGSVEARYMEGESGIVKKVYDEFNNLVNVIEEPKPDISKMETTCCSCERSVIDRVKTGCIEVDGKTYCRHCISLTHSDKNVVKRANADNADALEYRKPTESMWKPISELLEYQNHHVIGKMKTGKCFIGFPYQLEDESLTIKNIDGIGGNSAIYFQSFCTLTDFINNQETIERRIERLEQLILNK
jgi:hypothetical protein